ncbi:MAG TPA: alpha/beta fold hydrolase [Casimicrobiaceae bacterium]|nr:alpha/beta fold hydrolase [Casimicrobiaceae bacterium]
MADGTAHALPQFARESAPLPPYRSPAWLRGGHAQTIWPYLLPRPAVAYRRERIETHDGDFWDFDWLDAPQVPHAPLVALFHGLEGNSGSHYALALMTLLAQRGLRGVVAHYRGCSGEANRLPRAYHSGDHEELDAMLAAIRARVPAPTPIYAVGVSVGGSVLINWLGRKKGAAARIVAAAAAVSTPLDLEAAGIAIAKGANRIYTRNFLSTLKPKSLAMARRFPGLLDSARIRRARTLRAFDDAVTSLLHGFVDATDYWRRASSKPWLASVAVPTLVLNAKNDPFVPRETLPRADEASRDVLLVQPEHGGHAGFLTGSFPGRLDWAPRRLLDFFLHHR